MTRHRLLLALPDASRITVHAGQVLVYPRHTPPGLFVVLAGTLCRFADGLRPAPDCRDLWDTRNGPFAIPAPEEVGEPAAAGVAANTDAELFFVPRSVVIARTDLARVLDAAGVGVVRLTEASRPRGSFVTLRRMR